MVYAQCENGPVSRKQDEPEGRRRIRVLLQPVDRADQYDPDGRKNHRSVPLPSFLVRRCPESVGRLVQQEPRDEVKGIPECEAPEDELLSAQAHGISVRQSSAVIVEIAWRRPLPNRSFAVRGPIEGIGALTEPRRARESFGQR